MTLLRKLGRLFGLSPKEQPSPIVVDFRSDKIVIKAPSAQSDQGAKEWRVADFRSEEEKLLDANARAGKVDSDLEQTVDKLLACVQLSESSKQRSQRLAHLGEILHRQGGMSRMVLAAYRFEARGGDGDELSEAWDGVGEWQH